MASGIDRHRLPASAEEWKNMVKQLSIQKKVKGEFLTLSKIQRRDLREKPLRPAKVGLSGSKMAKDDWLFLRAVWPETCKDTDILESFRQSQKLLHEQKLIDNASYTAGLKRLGISESDLVSTPQSLTGTHLSNRIAISTPPPRHGPLESSVPLAPRKPSSLVGDPANHSASVFQRFCDVLEYQRASEIDACNLGAFFNAANSFATLARLPLNWPADGYQQLGKIPDEIFDEECDSLDTYLNGDIAADLEALAQYTPTRAPDTSGILEPHRNNHAPAGAAEGGPSPPDDPRPTIDETSVTVFMTTFFDTLSSILHPGGEHHTMVPIREQFSCRQSQHHGRVLYFRAAVDAVVRSRTPKRDRNNHCLVFLCEYKRDTFREVKWTVALQETAEVVAYLAELHSADPSTSNGLKDKKNVTCPPVLMLTQYDTTASLVLVTYSAQWLEYILDGTMPVYEKNLDNEHMVHMQRLGVFSLTDGRHVRQMSVLIAAILIKDQRHNPTAPRF